MNTTFDVELKKHKSESLALHSKLQQLNGTQGKSMSLWLANTTVHAAIPLLPTAQEVVLENTRTILTILNKPGGPKAIGFESDGKLARCMVVADINSEAMGFHSTSIALIRELCASFYGPIESGFANATLLRHEIDNLARQTDALGMSLLLVLSAPFGAALTDRFWRLCSIERVPDGNILDSRFVLASMQRPGVFDMGNDASLLGKSSKQFPVCEKVVNAMFKQWRSRSLDAIGDELSAIAQTAHAPPGTPGSEQQQKLLKVMHDVNSDLRARCKDQAQQLLELQTKMAAEIQIQVDAEIEKERAIWMYDIEKLSSDIEHETNLYTSERARGDVLASELAHIDEVHMQEISRVVESYERRLRQALGDNLVLTESKAVATKRASETRKREADLRKEREKHEAIVEALQSQRTSLETKLQEQKLKYEESKRSADEHLANLLEGRKTNEDELNELRSKALASTKASCDSGFALATALSNVQALECTNQNSNAKLKELTLASKFFVRLTRKLRKKNADQQVKQVEQVDQTKIFDLVAKSKGLISHLNSFVDLAQTQAPRQPQQPQQPPQQPQHPQHPQHPQQYRAFAHHQMHPHFWPSQPQMTLSPTTQAFVPRSRRDAHPLLHTTPANAHSTWC